MQVRKAYIDVAAGQMHYCAAAGAGVPIVFFHQTASSYKMWLKVLDQLDLGLPMYAFDTPGFGGSFDPDGATSMPMYADWMAEAMTALGIDRAHVVGHHTGAAIGAELAARRPDLVASVTLIGPLPLTEAEREQSAKQYGPAFLPEPTGRYLLDNWTYMSFGEEVDDPLVLHREMADMLRAYLSRPFAYQAVWGQDFTAAYRAIACPLQIMCAPDDVLYPFFQRAAEIRPDAVAHELGGGGNFEPDLRAGEVADRIAVFIRGVAA